MTPDPLAARLRADLKARAEALNTVEKWLARPETEPAPGLRTIAALTRERDALAKKAAHPVEMNHWRPESCQGCRELGYALEALATARRSGP